jgi:predicted RNase H-like HicB family nuclease
MRDYHINVFWSEDNDGYVADIPDLDACSAFGDTPQEAVSEVLLAKEAWLEAARANGKPVPEPSYPSPDLPGGSLTRAFSCGQLHRQSLDAVSLRRHW